MGADPVSAAIMGGSFLVSSLASYALSPKAPSTDATNYELLMQTQAQANAESEAAKAKIEEAKGNKASAAMERGKGNVKGAYERAKGKMNEMKAKSE